MPRDIFAGLDERVLVCQGPVAGALAEKGVVLRCGPEANLTHPHLVLDIHNEFRTAGADLLLTNTGNAGPYELDEMGLLGQAHVIWSASVELCREAAGPDALVAAAISPSGRANAGGELDDEIRNGYRQQLEVMLRGQVDAVLLDGFPGLDELRLATQAAREVDGAIAVIATISLAAAEADAGRVDAAECALRLAERGVALIGVSGGAPEMVEAAFRHMVQVTGRAVFARPDFVSGPGGKALSPAAAGRCASGLIGCGARIVGGAAGCGPRLLMQVSKAARASV